jgi:hypothetical protein
MGLLGLSKRNPKYHQGYYQPKNPFKFIGEGPIIYRSGLELKFMRWCDNAETVLRWSSESVKIPYYDSVQRKNRHYFVDNFVEIKEGSNIKRYLVEIKPFRQTQEPKATKGKKKSSLLYETVAWKNNCDKWSFARDFAKKHGMEFIIITEKELNQ